MRWLAPWLTALLVTGCAEEAPDAEPEGAVLAFIEAMEESRYDDRERATAFALLDRGSRAELERRAARAEALGRTGLEPWEMLAAGRFRLAFEPRDLTSELSGVTGVVEVRGSRGERARIPVVREEDGWRIRLLEPAEGTGE